MATTWSVVKARSMVGKPRITPDGKYVSVFDIICSMTAYKNPSRTWSKLEPKLMVAMAAVAADPTRTHRTERFLKWHLFPGRGQTKVPVVNALGAVEIMLMLPGPKADIFRSSSGANIVRYLGGDQTLISRIKENAATAAFLPTNSVQGFCSKAIDAAREYPPLEEMVKQPTSEPQETDDIIRLKILRETVIAEKQIVELARQRVEYEQKVANIQLETKRKLYKMKHQAVVAQMGFKVFKQMKDVWCPKPADTDLYPHVLVVRKNAEPDLYDVSWDRDCSMYEYIFVRRQIISVRKQLRGLRERYPKMVVILQLFHPSAITAVCRFKEVHGCYPETSDDNVGIDYFRTHFAVCGVPPAEQDNWIKDALKRLTQFSLSPFHSELLEHGSAVFAKSTPPPSARKVTTAQNMHTNSGRVEQPNAPFELVDLTEDIGDYAAMPTISEMFPDINA
jgi:hypothetical protein